jgi:ABC-type Fe3+/spermidine/putrescine transport system ATPase subunit
MTSGDRADGPGRPADATTAGLSATGVAAGYGGTPVITGLDIDVAAGEVLALLGPSGSGKTTFLAAVAGFLHLAAGELRIAGQLVAAPGVHVPPERRGVGVVFQSYALWPHLSALDNVAYPIRRRGASATAARADAGAILERLGIAALAGRRPAELSGGEQQRVGLGRALAREARLYLFDEPTAHLDAPLRTRLQDELAEHRRRTGAAAVYATHDTAEALALADRVALLRLGRVIQQGTPTEVYERPVDLWAAQLTGPASVLDVRVVAGDGRPRIALGDQVTEVPVEPAADAEAGVVSVLVRPDWAHLGGPLAARVSSVAYRGTHTDYQLETPGGTVELRSPGAPTAARGAAVGWTLERAWALADRDPA